MQISDSELAIARRHIQKQTGLLLTDEQLVWLWKRSGLGSILHEVGRIDRWVCIDLVDELCFEVLGHDWPLNGEVGEADKPFYHRFITEALKAGYVVDAVEVAA